MRTPRAFSIVTAAALVAACGGDTSGSSPLEPGAAPTAWFAFSCSGLTCAFGDQSYAADAAGRVASYVWDFGDGQTSSERSPSHAYTAEGMYTVALTVTDDRGEQGSVSRQVGPVVSGLPTYSFTVNCTFLACSFTADIPFTVVSPAARWDFGDGAASTALNPSHTYAVTESTTFMVTLKVDDFDGFESVASREVTVGPAAP